MFRDKSLHLQQNKVYTMNEYLTYGMTDGAVLRTLGGYIKQMRLNARISQNDLSECSGVSRNTITAIENGKSISLSSLIAILRYLRKFEVLDAFRTSAPVSPMAIVRNNGKQPQRIRSSKRQTKESEW